MRLSIACAHLALASSVSVSASALVFSPVRVGPFGTRTSATSTTTTTTTTATATTTTAFTRTTTSATRPIGRVGRSSSRSITAPLTSLRMANVPRLSDPKIELLDNVDVFIFDCDGVIWRGDSLIEGVPSTLSKLRSLGKRMFFVTNNSTKSRRGYKSKFDSLGLDDVPPEEIFSSSFAAAAYLEQTKFKDSGKSVYVIGEVGIGEELDLIGVDWFGGPDDAYKNPDMGPGGKLEHDTNVGAVVVGFDRAINYYKIQYAQLCINENEGCEFVATNTDAVTHLTDAQEWAGNGSMVGAVRGCTGREPTVVGKPSPLMIDYLTDRLRLDKGRICMVGDRLDTDVLFGTDNGLRTVLVLSGVTTEERLLSAENDIAPDFYADTINDFFGGGGTTEEADADADADAEAVAEVEVG